MVYTVFKRVLAHHAQKPDYVSVDGEAPVQLANNGGYTEFIKVMQLYTLNLFGLYFLLSAFFITWGVMTLTMDKSACPAILS